MAQRKRKKARPSTKEVIPAGFFGYNNLQVRKFRKKCGLKPLTGNEGEVTCLRCQKEFQSKDRRSNRVCDRCKGSTPWKEGSRDGPALYQVPTHVPTTTAPKSKDGGKAHREQLSAQRFITRKEEKNGRQEPEGSQKQTG